MGKKCYKILSLWIGLTKQETICFICMFWYCWIQTSPTGDHPYSDTSPLPTASVVCSIFLPHLRICCSIWQRTIIFWRIRVSPNFLLTALHVTQVDWLNCVVTKIWELILHHQNLPQLTKPTFWPTRICSIYIVCFSYYYFKTTSCSLKCHTLVYLGPHP